MNDSSLFKVTKEQLFEGLERRMKLDSFQNEIRQKLQEEVEIKSFFGLFKKKITKHGHILKHCGWNYYVTAMLMNYITEKEEDILNHIRSIPYTSSIKDWLKAEEVYLSSRDFEKLCTLLYKQPGE